MKKICLLLMLLAFSKFSIALSPIEIFEEAITGKRKAEWKLREEQRKKNEIIEHIQFYLKSSSGVIFTKIIVDDPIGCNIESESTYSKVYRHDKNQISATKIEDIKNIKYKKSKIDMFCKGLGQALSENVKNDFNLKIDSDGKSIINIDDDEIYYCIPLPGEDTGVCSYKKITINSERIEDRCIRSYINEEGDKSVEILCPDSSPAYLRNGISYKSPFYFREYEVDVNGRRIKAVYKRFYIPNFKKRPLDEKSARWKLNEAENRMMDKMEKEAKEARDK